MATIFENSYNALEAWSASGAIITWGIGTDPQTAFPLMLSAVALSYSRTQQNIFPVNTSTETLKKVVLLGAPQGRLDCTGIIGPNDDVLEFLTTVGGSCITSDSNITVKIQPFGRQCQGSASGGSPKAANAKQAYTLGGVVLQTFGINIRGGEVALVTQPLVFTFASLSID